MAHEFSQGTLTAGTCYLSKPDVEYIWSMTGRIADLESELQEAHTTAGLRRTALNQYIEDVKELRGQREALEAEADTAESLREQVGEWTGLVGCLTSSGRLSNHQFRMLRSVGCKWERDEVHEIKT